MWKFTGIAEVGARLPQRIPVPIREIGVAVVLRVGVRVHAPQPELVRPRHLGHRGVDVPPREQRHGEHALAGDVLELRHRVVVDRGAEHLERRVDDLREPLPTEPDDVRVHDLRVDAERVHHLEARPDRGRALVDLVDPEVHELGADGLRSVGENDGSTDGLAEHLAVDGPHRSTLHLAHLRHPVDPFLRRARRPEVVRLGQVRVGIDDVDAFEDGNVGSHAIPQSRRCLKVSWTGAARPR